ncbi:MAG TPA: hypothetical protein VNJ01_11275 [Bacteriovoracaceae bacterium]|nr:hypothetical protein [Bacteriovoracaceae bacterium]
MKAALFSLPLLVSLSHLAHAKVIYKNNQLFVETKGKQVPVLTVNTLISENKIEAIKLFADGQVNAISFAKKGEKEKIYSIDEKGFAYSLEPFASYKVQKTDPKGFITFKEFPKRKYRVTEKGFFIY